MYDLMHDVEVSTIQVMVRTDTTMIDRLKQFVESEMCSCSMEE